MGKNNLSGAWGEAQAAQYLRKKHFKLVAAGYRSRFGEIDLIVQDRKFLVFVEVKLRKNEDFARAADYVDRNKQDRLRLTASMYLSQHPTKLQPRFDVVEVYLDRAKRLRAFKINHIPDAFGVNTKVRR